MTGIEELFIGAAWYFRHANGIEASFERIRQPAVICQDERYFGILGVKLKLDNESGVNRRE